MQIIRLTRDALTFSHPIMPEFSIENEQNIHLHPKTLDICTSNLGEITCRCEKNNLLWVKVYKFLYVCMVENKYKPFPLQYESFVIDVNNNVYFECDKEKWYEFLCNMCTVILKYKPPEHKLKPIVWNEEIASVFYAVMQSVPRSQV